MELAALWQDLDDLLVPTLRQYRSRLGSLHVEQKSDTTLLSEADIAIEAQIIACIRAREPEAVIIAEESAHLLGVLGEPGSAERIWIIDPIDGTAQFVAEDRREFCNVVCLVEQRRPVAAYVLAPELGPRRSPVSVRYNGVGSVIEVNGQSVSGLSLADDPRLLSVTRSSGSEPRPYEPLLISCGYELKTRTTSQTLDMVRSCIDLSSFTEPSLPAFGLFYREQQKLWDGAAGMCLARAAGLTVMDGAGTKRTTVDVALDVAEPLFESTLVAADEAAAQIVISSPR
ncbi:MAG: inositol monophosphatase family protein [Pseudonocardiaceae bacterium]